MPLLDVLIVSPESASPGLASALADTVGRVLGAAPGRVWVRMHTLAPEHYAENGGPPQGEWPVFLTLTHARLPQGEALAREATVLTQAVAAVVGRASDRVHLEYAPAGAGRMVFGGVLVG